MSHPYFFTVDEIVQDFRDPGNPMDSPIEIWRLTGRMTVAGDTYAIVREQAPDMESFTEITLDGVTQGEGTWAHANGICDLAEELADEILEDVHEARRKAAAITILANEGRELTGTL